MWLVAWKLVSNDAKRTVAPPNAKHSTLPPRLFFMFFVFDYIHDSATIRNLSPAKKPKGRFFWYAFGIYKPKETPLWFVSRNFPLNP